MKSNQLLDRSQAFTRIQPAAPEDFASDLARAIETQRALTRRDELEQQNRQGYVRHKLPYWQYEALLVASGAAREQAAAQASYPALLTRALSDGEIDALICPDLIPAGESRSLASQKKRLAAARAMARLLRDWSCAVGCEIVITSRPILRRALERKFGLSVSLRTIDRARPLLALAGVPLFAITHDHDDTTRGLATVLPALPLRAQRKISVPLSPEAELEAIVGGVQASLFDAAQTSDLATPHGLTAQDHRCSCTNADRTRDEIPEPTSELPLTPTKAPGGQKVPGDWRVNDLVLPDRLGIQAFEAFWRRYESLGEPKVSYRRHAPQFIAAVGALSRHVGHASAVRFVYELIDRAGNGEQLVDGKPFEQPQSLAALTPMVRFKTRCLRRAARRDRDARILADYVLPSADDVRQFADALRGVEVPSALRLAGFARGELDPAGRLRQRERKDDCFWRRPPGSRRVAVLSGDFETWRSLRGQPAFFADLQAACSSVGAIAFTFTGERNLYLTEVLALAGWTESRDASEWRVSLTPENEKAPEQPEAVSSSFEI